MRRINKKVVWAIRTGESEHEVFTAEVNAHGITAIDPSGRADQIDAADPDEHIDRGAREQTQDISYRS